MAKIAAVIADYDVCFLQEVQWHAELDRAFGATHHVVHAYHDEQLWQPHSGERHGNTTLIRRDLIKGAVLARSVQLSGDGNTALIVRLPSSALTLINVHLECEEDVECITGTEFSWRRHLQSRCVLNHVPVGDTVIWAGDFNAPQSTPELSHISHHFVDATSMHIARSEYDHNEHVYSGPVDAVLVRGAHDVLAVDHFERPHSSASLAAKIAFLLQHYGSDHVPVGATLLLHDVAPPRSSLRASARLLLGWRSSSNTPLNDELMVEI